LANLSNVFVIFIDKKSADFVNQFIITQIASLPFLPLGKLDMKSIVMSFHFHSDIKNDWRGPAGFYAPPLLVGELHIWPQIQ